MCCEIGSDGLWDNLFDETIVELIRSSSNNDVTTLADSIATYARNISQALVTTPFARAAVAAGHQFALGGKLDDISVIVSRVCRGSKNENTNGQS